MLPEPSVPELYPYMRAGEDAPWHAAKAEIGSVLRELTVLPRMNPSRRRLAHAAGIRGWDDERASAEAFGVPGADGAARLDAVLAANRSLVPIFLPLTLPADDAWRTPAPVEFYVDFETVSNLAEDFSALPAVGGWAGIFQIGCGWLDASGEWRFRQWTADRLDDASEAAIIGSWLSFMAALCEHAGAELDAARMCHWSAAESAALDAAPVGLGAMMGAWWCRRRGAPTRADDARTAPHGRDRRLQ